MRSDKEANDEPVYCYLNGVEIGSLEPRLPFLDLDDWFNPFLTWVKLYHFDKPVHGVFTPTEPHSESMLYSVWVVGTPPKADMVPPKHSVGSFSFVQNRDRN